MSACTYVICYTYICLVPKEARRECMILYFWSSKTALFDPIPDPTQEHQVFLDTETSLQAPDQDLR